MTTTAPIETERRILAATIWPDRINQAYYGELGEDAGRRARDRINWMCSRAQGDTVLDIGCSQGITTILLAREGAEVVGIDISEEAITYARKEQEREVPSVARRIDFICGDLASLDRERQFDSVILGEVLEHQANTSRFLNHAIRHVKPGGTLIVTVPFGLHPFPDHRSTIFPRDILSIVGDRFSVSFFDIHDGYIRFVAEKGSNTDPRILEAAAKLTEQGAVEVQEKYFTLHTKQAILNKKNAEFKRNLDDISVQLASAVALRDALERNKKNLQETIRNLELKEQAALADSTLLAQKKAEQVEYLQVEITETRSQRDRLGLELQAVQKAHAALEEAKAAATAQHQKVMEESAAQRTELESQLLAARKAQALIEEENAATVVRLQAAIEAHTAERVELQTQLLAARKAQALIEEENAATVVRLQAAIEAHTAERVELQTQLLAARKAQALIEEENAATVVRLQAAIVARTAERAELQNQLLATQEAYTLHEHSSAAELAALRVEIAGMQVQRDTLESVLQEQTQAYASLQHDQAEQDEKHRAASLKLVAQQAELELRLQAERNALECLAQEKSAQLAVLQSDIAGALARQGELEFCLREAVEAKISLQQNVSAEEAQRRSAARDWLSQKAALESQLQMAKHVHVSLEEEKNAQIKKLQSEMAAAVVRQMDSEARLQTQVYVQASMEKEKNGEINTLQKQIQMALDGNEKTAAAYRLAALQNEKKIEAIYGTLSFRLGNLLLLAPKSLRGLLSLPGNLMALRRDAKLRRRSKGGSKKEVSPTQMKLSIKEVESTFLPPLQSLYAEKGLVSVQDFVVAASMLPEARAHLYTQLAKMVAAAAPGDACAIGMLAYAEEPRAYRAKWLAFLQYNCGNVSDAMRLLDSVPEDMNMTPSETLKSKQIRGHHRIAAHGIALPVIPPRPAYTAIPHTVLYMAASALPYHVSGYTVRTQGLLEAVQKAGWTLTCGMRPGYPGDRPDAQKNSLGDQHIVGTINYRRIKGPNRREVEPDLFIEQAAQAIEKAALQQKPALIHAASNYENALPALIAARRLGIPFVYEVRGLWELTAASKKINWENTELFAISRTLETLVAANADCVLTLTQALADELVARGVPDNKIFLAPNAVDPDKFAPVGKNLGLMRSLGLDSKVFTVVYVGAIVNYEGLDDLLGALALLKKTGSALNLIIAGDGEALPGLKALAEQLKIDEQVRFVGKIAHAEAASYWALADAAVFPRKPFKVCQLVSPLKPLEAIVIGKPVIASDLPALKELVTDGITGLLFPATDIKALAACLSRLMAEPQLAARLGKNARAAVLRERTWPIVGEAIARHYQRLCGYGSLAANAVGEDARSPIALTTIPSPAAETGKKRIIVEKIQTFDIDSSVPGGKLELLPESRPLHIEFSSAGQYCITGRFEQFPAEMKNFAVLIFEFEKFEQSEIEEIKRESSCGYSEKIGFYRYISPHKGGDEFDIVFSVPVRKKISEVRIRLWGKPGTVIIDNEIKVEYLGAAYDLSADDESVVRSSYEQSGVSATLRDIKMKWGGSEREKADRAEFLFKIAACHNDAEASRILDRALSFDHSNMRVRRLAERAIQCGMVHLPARLLQEEYDEARGSVSEAVMLERAVSRSRLLRNGVTVPAKATKLQYRPDPSTSLYLCYFSLPYHSNGYATRSHGLLRALKEGGRNFVVCSRPGYPWDINTAKQIHDYDVVDGVIYRHLSGSNLTRQSREQYFETASQSIEAIAKTHRVSVIHASSNYLLAIPALLAARRLGIPFVYEVRGLWEITQGAKVDFEWCATEAYQLDVWGESLVAKHADALLPITNALRDEMVARGARTSLMRVAPNGVNLEQFKPMSKNQVLARRLGLSDAVTIGFIGSFVDYEGLEDLVEAAQLLKQQGAKFNLLLVGDGESFDCVKRLVEQLDLTREVVLTGRVPFDQVADYYSVIDIAPFPRKPLPVCEMVSPLKPFEAMAMEKAVLASDVGALAEIVMHERTGLLFRKGSVSDLAEKLRRMLDNPALIAEYGQAGRAWVMQERTWEATAQIIEDMHAELVREERCEPASLVEM